MLGEEPDRGGAEPFLVRNDQVNRVRVVELVDIIRAVDHRDVPTEQVNEEAFAVCEHGLQQWSVGGRPMVVDDVDHRHVEDRSSSYSD